MIRFLRDQAWRFRPGAAVAAGLAFDPKEAIEPDSPYLRILNPGISQLGEFEPVSWGRFGKLHIYLPPPQNLIASKLVRGERRDVEDILFLATKHRVQASAVRDCVEAFPEPAHTQALENCDYLDLLSP